MTTVIPLFGPKQPGPAAWGEAQDDLTPDQEASATAAAAAGYAWRQEVERKQIVPVWLRHPVGEGVPALRFYVGGWWHAVRFHAVRVPKYWARVAALAPAGTGRLVRASWHLAIDKQGAERLAALTSALAEQGTGAAAVASGAKAHKWSAIIGFFVWLVMAGVAVWALLSLGLWGWATGSQVAMALPGGHVFRRLGAAIGAAVVLGVVAAMLGYGGRPPDKRVRDWAVDKQDGPPTITQELVLKALASLGIAALTRAIESDPRSVEFRGLPHRQGNGVRVEVDLPPGTTAAEVIERRAKLASALRHPLGCVWPEAAPEIHEGRLVLYVANTALSQAKLGPWALSKGRADVFEPMPIGHNQRGEVVAITLAFNSGVIGAIPRMGKTFLLRLIGLIFGLDVRARLYVYDLKGAGDLKPLAKLAHRYGVGDDDETVRQALADMLDLQADMRKRYETVRNLPPDVCPESKVTPELAGRRSLGLYPVGVLADEIQLWFEHPTYGKELEAVVTDLVKRGPAVLICVWLATQRPDAKSLPTAIRDNVSLRLCLKVTTHIANDMVLGTGAHSSGNTAVQFLGSDKGVAMLVGEGAPTIVRTPAITVPEAMAIADRAAAARAAAGWQATGYAAGEALPAADTDSGVSVLEDCRDVWAAGAAGMTFEQLAARLADHRPGAYGTWGVPQVSAALRSHGLQVVNVRDGKRSPKGIKHDALLAALAKHFEGGAGE